MSCRGWTRRVLVDEALCQEELIQSGASSPADSSASNICSAHIKRHWSAVNRCSSAGCLRTPIRLAFCVYACNISWNSETSRTTCYLFVCNSYWTQKKDVYPHVVFKCTIHRKVNKTRLLWQFKDVQLQTFPLWHWTVFNLPASPVWWDPVWRLNAPMWEYGADDYPLNITDSTWALCCASCLPAS